MNIESKDDLARLVSGVLRSAIKDHGPVTATNLASASKRIAGPLAEEFKKLADKSTDVGLKLKLEQQEQEIRLLKKQNNGLRKTRSHLLSLLRSNGLLPEWAGGDAEESAG
jgi:hypothetical protein